MLENNRILFRRPRTWAAGGFPTGWRALSKTYRQFGIGTLQKDAEVQKKLACLQDEGGIYTEFSFVFGGCSSEKVGCMS